MIETFKPYSKPNAHSQDDFFLFDETFHPIKTQTLMWYLERLSQNLHSHIKTNKGNLNNDIRLLDQLIVRLKIDESSKISHISKTLKAMNK